MELVEMILQWAFTVDLVQRVTQRTLRYESPPLLTIYLSEAKSQHISGVSVRIRGSIYHVASQEQLQAPDAWYSVQTVDDYLIGDSARPQWQDSSDVIVIAQDYNLFWDRESYLVRGIKDARRVIVWAHARSAVNTFRVFTLVLTVLLGTPGG